MESFEGRLAVVTGGGTGMGRELVVQLAAAGASVAACDVHDDTVAETKALAEAANPAVTVSTHRCDVSNEADVLRFRDEVLGAHGRDHVNLVFNNAGISGAGSFVTAPREEWDRTFAVTWGGVYLCARAFVPLLVAADEGVLVNTSSVNGFWASLGPGVPHTAYSAAKFAVKGFTEALQDDFRVNAPHLRAVLVMPGHVGTDIVRNSYLAHGAGGTLAQQFGAAGDQEAADRIADQFATAFREHAPVIAAEAATIILDAVRAGEWRVLIGDDARALDEAVRADPWSTYGPDGVNPYTRFS